MKEIENNKLSELNKLFKLIWQKKKCYDNKSWKYFFFCISFELFHVKQERYAKS